MLKKLKTIRPHCTKYKKCARTAPNAKKCGTCRKTQKMRDFRAANNRIFLQGVNYCMSKSMQEFGKYVFLWLLTLLEVRTNSSAKISDRIRNFVGERGGGVCNANG